MTESSAISFDVIGHLGVATASSTQEDIRGATVTPRSSGVFFDIRGQQSTLGPGVDGFIKHSLDHNLGPGVDGFVQSIPSHGLGPGTDGLILSGAFMGIRSKQMQTGTFGATTEGRAPFGAGLFDNTLASSVFAAGSIPGSKLVSGGVDETSLNTSVAGNGITGGGGTALSVEPNVTDNGGVPGIEVAANGARLSAAAAGAGLAGGAGTALNVGAGTGIVANANDVALALATGTPTYSGTHVSTFPVDALQVTGTPDTANDAVNKAYVDNLASGASWQEPVFVKEYVGSEGAATIEGLTPTTGDAYVVDDVTAGEAPAGDLVGATVGDLWEYDGDAGTGGTWNLIIAGVGGFVADGTRGLVSTQTTLIAPMTDATDDGKIAKWDGTSLTPTLDTPLDQWAVLVTDQDSDGDSVFANNAYAFQGIVPTGSWNQFSGAGSVNAGTGLSKAGNTLNVGAGDGITVGATDVSVDVDSETGGNIAPANLTANGVGVDINAIAGTGLEADGSANLRLAAQGDGLNGGAGSTLSVDALDASISVAAGGISVNPASLIQSGAQEVDGDLLDIDYAQTNYTPATTGVATDLNHLAAHLEGIDNELGTIASSSSTPTIQDKNITAAVTAADGASTGAAITTTPIADGYVKVEINGIGYPVGDAVKTTECYFSGDGGTTARAIAAIVATDTLRWNGTIAGFELDATDRIDLHYDL